MKRAALFLLLVPATMAALHVATIGPLLLDDAYISFRYAVQCADGHGLVFNEGERVQGFTNPLYTLALAAAAAGGIDIPAAATALGALAAAATGALLVFFLGGRTGRIAGTLAAIALLLTPEFVLNSLSGMETVPFGALLLGTAFAAHRGRLRLAGVLAGLLVITRPDGLLLVGPAAAMLAGRDRRSLPRAVLPALGIGIAWVAFAWAYYGDPVPASVAAKRVIHPGEFGPIVGRHLQYLGGGVGLRAMWALAAVGLAYEVRARGRLLPWAAGSALYLAGLGASGIMPFEVPRYFLWYPVPLVPLGFLFAARGAHGLARSLRDRVPPARTAGVVAAIPLAAAAFSFARLHDSELPRIRAHFDFRERGYEAVAAAIREDAGARTADVLVGEVGVVGYRLPGHRVHDSSGINSPEILRYRAEDRAALEAEGGRGAARDEGSPRWVLRFLRDRRPDYVTTLRLFLHLPALESLPAFQALYEPVAPDVWIGEGRMQHTVYGRRDRERAP